MDKRVLRNGLEVSAVGLGCMGFSHAYGTATETSEAISTIRQAFDMGCTFFDTAECYIGENADGSTSCNEELVGKALAPIRDQVVIATKCGVRHEGRMLVMDSRPETIRRSVEGSLKRLGTDHIDLYYQHRIDPNVPAEDVAGTMSELIWEGKILYWGISETDENYLRRAHAVCPVTAVQNRYSMMARWHENLFPVVKELGVGFVAFSPMANGLLTGCYNAQSQFDLKTDFRAAMPQYSKESFDKNQALFDLVNSLAAQYDATPAQISLAWMINKGIVPIPGTRKMARLEENAGSADIEMTADELKRIDAALDSMEMSEVFGGSKIVR